MRLSIVFVFCTEIFLTYCSTPYITITHNGPVVLGATISFKADIVFSDGHRPTEKYKCKWRDNAIPSHTSENDASHAECFWNASYPASEGYAPGPYEVEVSVEKWPYLWPVTSQRVQFDVTAKLNGELKVMQLGKTISGQYISNAEEVKHEVALSSPDLDFLSRAPQVYSFWYVDCVYYGQSEGYDFLFNFTQEEKTHIVEVLVMASFDPLPTPEPSTTTTVAPTTTSSAPNGTNTTTSSTSTTTSTTSAPPTTVKNIEVNGGLMTKQMLATNLIADVPYICMNSSFISPDPKKTYGYFSRQLTVKAPVSNVSIDGKQWLPHGDILDLQIRCKGSFPYTHCVQVKSGLYNATGNETCEPGESMTSPYCEFSYRHYFSLTTTYTLLIIIGNDVDVKVTQVGVTIYEAMKKTQLSVIVVPVVCTILAVVLVIFGVAYYVQNRRRFVVEVADFHFGHVDADMECKTFHERLKEAIMNAFSRSIVDDDNSDSDSECDKRTGRGRWPQRGVGNAAGPSSSGMSGGPNSIGGRGDARGQKYGSME